MTWVWDVKHEQSRARAADYIGQLDLSDGKLYAVTVKPARKRRTLAQNALYWQWVGEVAEYVSEATGYERDEIHEYFKQRFLPESARTRIKILDSEVWRWSTTKLSAKEMADYTDRIFRWATTELGLTLTLPPTAERRG